MKDNPYGFVDSGPTPPPPPSPEEYANTPLKKWHVKVPKKPPMILEPLQQATWDQMSGKARWDSIVALRGPDLVGSDALKYFTTSVIRYRLSKIMRVGGMINERLGFVCLPSGLCLSSNPSPFDATHFLNHVMEAAGWLDIPICYVPPDAYTVIKGSSWTSGRIELLSWISKNSDDPFKSQALFLLGGF